MSMWSPGFLIRSSIIYHPSQHLIKLMCKSCTGRKNERRKCLTQNTKPIKSKDRSKENIVFIDINKT